MLTIFYSASESFAIKTLDVIALSTTTLSLKFDV